MKIQTTADVATIEWPPYVMPGMKTPIKPPNPLQEFADHPWVFGDSNFDPNFPGTARDGELTFFNQTGKRVDGVISLDPWAIALLLTATGPLRLPEYSATVDGATFPEDVFQREQAHPNDPEFARTRKQFLAAVAKNLIERLTALPADQWTKVIDAMNTAVTQKHLQVYFNDATAQSGMANFGWAGQLIGASSQQEFLMEVESNFGATKANHFMQRRYDLRLVAEGATLKHNLTVTLKNSTPTGYVNGRYYRVYVRVYVPANATGLSAQNLFRDRLPTQEQQKGLALMDGWWQVNVDPRLGYGTSTFIFSWNTPLSGDTGHSIYWQKQSGTLSDAITVSYTAGGHTTTAQPDLTQDRRLARHLQEPRRADLRPGRRSPGRRHTLAVRQPPGRSGLPRERHVEGTLVAAPPGVRGRHRVCDHAGGRTQAGLHFQSQGRGDRHADQRRFQRMRQGSAGARWNRLLSQVRGSGSGQLLGARPQRWEVAAFTLGSLAALATGLLATVLNDRRLLLLIVVAAAVLFAGYAITA